MKTKGMVASVAMAAMLSLIVSTGFTLVPVTQDDNGGAVYDYSNFGQVGTFTSVTDPANSKVTHIYANMRITGHYGEGKIGGVIGTEAGAWNVEEVTWFNANGTVAKTFDVVNNITDYYSVNGKLVKRETVLEAVGLRKQTYESYPQYDSKGGYTLATKGLFKDPTKPEGEGATTVDVKSIVYVDANGRTQWEKSYGLDEKGVKTESISTFKYDAAGNLAYRQTKDQSGNVTSTLYYKFGRPDRAENTDYTPNKDGTQNTIGTKTSVKYNYSGNRLLSTQTYDKLGYLTETTLFDAFGRADKVTDAIGRVTGQYTYNDSGHDITASLEIGGKTYTVTVKAGGCSLFEGTIYDANSDAKKVDHTIYYNGNTNTPLGYKTISNNIPATTGTGSTGTTGTGSTGTTGTGSTTPPATPTPLTATQIKALQTEETRLQEIGNGLSAQMGEYANQADLAQEAGNVTKANEFRVLRDKTEVEYNANLHLLLDVRSQITAAGASFI